MGLPHPCRAQTSCLDMHQAPTVLAVALRPGPGLHPSPAANDKNPFSGPGAPAWMHKHSGLSGRPVLPFRRAVEGGVLYIKGASLTRASGALPGRAAGQRPLPPPHHTHRGSPGSLDKCLEGCQLGRAGKQRRPAGLTLTPPRRSRPVASTPLLKPLSPQGNRGAVWQKPTGDLVPGGAGRLIWFCFLCPANWSTPGRGTKWAGMWAPTMMAAPREGHQHSGGAETGTTEDWEVGGGTWGSEGAAEGATSAPHKCL